MAKRYALASENNPLCSCAISATDVQWARLGKDAFSSKKDYAKKYN